MGYAAEGQSLNADGNQNRNQFTSSAKKALFEGPNRLDENNKRQGIKLNSLPKKGASVFYPTSQPSSQPTGQPTGQPTSQPTSQPTGQPSGQPTGQPTSKPSQRSKAPSRSPTSHSPTTYSPTVISSFMTRSPTTATINHFMATQVSNVCVVLKYFYFYPGVFSWTSSGFRLLIKIYSIL